MSKFKQALEKYAKYVIQQSRSNLSKKKNNASKTLYNSLSYNIQGSNVTFKGEDYAQFVDKGVKGAKSTYPESRKSPFRYRSKMPPSSALDKWTVRKGIAPRSAGGQFVKRQSLNYIIARSIYKKGIRATMFFTKPFEAGLNKYAEEIIDGYIQDNKTP